jgi:hypothetical protein
MLTNLNNFFSKNFSKMEEVNETEIPSTIERMNSNPDEIYEDDKPHFSKKRDFREIAEISKKRSSFNMTYDKKKKMYTIVIPYDEMENKYTVKSEEIDFLDSKDYVLNTLDKLNQNFNSDKLTIPVIWLILISVFYISFTVSLIYTAFLLSLLCIFNPLIIIILFLGIYQFIKILVWTYFKIKERFRVKMIRNILSEENKISVDKKLNWEYGKGGAWLELLCSEQI